METIQISENSVAALDDAPATYLDWESDDCRQALQGIREGLEDLRAGRVEDAEVVFEELWPKHGLAR